MVMAVSKVGVEIIVASASDTGGPAAIAGHADGTFLVAWEGGPSDPVDSEDGDEYFYNEILARSFEWGTASGDSFVVNTERLDPQFDPDVTALAGGGYAVAYTSGVENHLYGAYVGSQVIDSTGTKYGAEVLTDNYSYYHQTPDVVGLADGGFAIVSTEEDNGELRLHAANGELTAIYGFGNHDGLTPTAVTALADDSVLVFWHGVSSPVFEETDEDVRGLWAEQLSLDGAGGGAFLIIAASDYPDRNFDPVASPLPDGKVALTWVSSTSGRVYAAVVDPIAGTTSAPVFVDVDAGDSNPDIAVLSDGRFVVTWQEASADGDSSGSGIMARVFLADGAADGAAFLVNDYAPGSQVAPTVAALGGDHFVIAWSGDGGLRAQIFSADTGPAPLIEREGTQDCSAAGNQVLTGLAGSDIFYCDVTASTGHDTIDDFKSTDVLVTNGKIYDSNNDGFITFGANGLIDIDGPGGASDTIAISNLSGASGLRFMGERDGYFVYADRTVRPARAIEGKLGDDALAGDVGDTKANVFFFDTALDLDLGHDTLTRFGGKDVLVTTTKLGEGPGNITFANGLNLPGTLGSGVVDIFDLNGAAAHELEFDGAVTRHGVQYFVYSLEGSAAGVSLVG